MIKHLQLKLGSMRKAQDFIVYPVSPGSTDRIVIQSDTRIAAFDRETGIGVLSNAHKNGAYFVHLQFDTVPVTVPADVLARILAAQPKSGDEIGPGVRIA